MSLTKDQILAADDLGLLEIKVKEWGGSVFCRVMSCGERDSYENDWVLNKAKGVENFRTKFLAKCLCDEKGTRLFTDAEVEQLAKKSAKVMSRVWQKAMEHNALTEADVEELGKG
ncbi:MAG: hypothetical protein WCG15_00210 [Actinomycetes bacterium]|jgi:hypothetical protein